MTTSLRIAVQYFLRALAGRMQDEKVSGIDPVWMMIFHQDELISIVRWIYSGKIPGYMDLDKMSSEDMLDIIADEYLIIDYILEQMNEELKDFDCPTEKSVRAILKQLGMQDHYLTIKPIAEWNMHDFAACKALSEMAGKPVPYYGIFPEWVTEDQKYFTGLMELHKFKSSAQSEIPAFENEVDFKLKVMML